MYKILMWMGCIFNCYWPYIDNNRPGRLIRGDHMLGNIILR